MYSPLIVSDRQPHYHCKCRLSSFLMQPDLPPHYRPRHHPPRRPHCSRSIKLETVLFFVIPFHSLQSNCTIFSPLLALPFIHSHSPPFGFSFSTLLFFIALPLPRPPDVIPAVGFCSVLHRR